MSSLVKSKELPFFGQKLNKFLLFGNWAIRHQPRLATQKKLRTPVSQYLPFFFQVFVKSKVTSLEDSSKLSDEERSFRQIMRRQNVFVLFPTKTSQNAANIFNKNVQNVDVKKSYVLVVIDGTW